MPRNKKLKKRLGMRRYLWRSSVAVAILVTLILILNRERPKPDSQPASPPVTYDMAMRFLSNYRVDDAERVLTAVLASHPDSVRVRDELRWMYFNQFRHRELEMLLEDGLRLRPGDFSLAVALLMSEFRPQNPREVLGYWERAGSRQPRQPRVLATLGYCYAHVGDAKQAEQAFQSALDLRADDVLVRVRVAQFLIDRGEWSSARQLLNWTDAKPLSDSKEELYQDQLWWIQSLVAESQDELDAALEHIERSLKRRPDELQYVQRRGTLLQLLGRTEEAADTFARANQLESYIGRLTEIVLSGDLENPTPELCREIAEICRLRGKTLQAETWKHAAAHVENSSGL